MSGLLVSFEGGEGAGKSTQIARLSAWLQEQGQPACVTRQPGGSVYGQRIRELILTPSAELAPGSQEVLSPRAELLLYLADRAHHVDAIIRPALAAGKVVLCDRYADSTLAYQGYGRGLDLDELRRLNASATGGLMPQLTIWFDLSPSAGRARIASRAALDRLEQESHAFHERVHAGYAALAAAEPERWHRLNAAESEETLQQHLRQLLLTRLAIQPEPDDRADFPTPTHANPR
ncbi:MAG: dTMP kinase [Candidatus Sericytochromatia bacterium]